MELKKSKEASNENLRIPIILMGFLFVGGVLLASFSYKVGVEADVLEAVKTGGNNQTYQEEVMENEPPPVEEPPQVEASPPPTETIVQQENTDTEPEATVAPPPPPEVKVEEEEAPAAEIIDFPDVEAEFPGGAAELQRWINQNVQYPETAIEMEDQGKVYLSFVVEPDGSITNIKVERGVTKELDREAKRVVRKMPKWNAGEAGGKKVRTRCRLPIVFTLK
jgi:protein TonB